MSELKSGPEEKHLPDLLQRLRYPVRNTYGDIAVGALHADACEAVVEIARLREALTLIRDRCYFYSTARAVAKAALDD